MYVETDTDCFDPNDPYSIGEDVAACVGFSQALQTMRLHDNNIVPSNMDNCCDHIEHHSQLVQGMIHGDAVPDNLSNQALSFGDHQAADGNSWDYQQVSLPDMAQNFDNNGAPVMLPDGQTPMITPAPDLLDLFHNLPPRTSSTLLHSQPIPALVEPLPVGAYDPLLRITPHPPPLIRDLFQSLPQGCYLGTNSLFGDEGDDNGGMMYHQSHHQDPDNGMLKFGGDISVCLGKRERKATKHFTTDKEKRCQMNDKFAILMSLIPNPTKVMNQFSTKFIDLSDPICIWTHTPQLDPDPVLCFPHINPCSFSNCDFACSVEGSGGILVTNCHQTFFVDISVSVVLWV